MSDYVQTKQSVMDKYTSRPTCWVEGTEQIVRFWIGNQCLGFPYWTVCATCYVPETKTLTIDFPLGTFIIIGPKAVDFYGAFCNNRATILIADGKDILSVSFDLRTNETAKDEE